MQGGGQLYPPGMGDLNPAGQHELEERAAVREAKLARKRRHDAKHGKHHGSLGWLRLGHRQHESGR